MSQPFNAATKAFSLAGKFNLNAASRKINCRSTGLGLAAFRNFAAHRAALQRYRLVNLPVDFHAELNIATGVG